MFELRDTIRRLDAETDYKYDLVGMYEATELSEPEKKLIATMIADAKDTEEIAGELFKIFNTQNAMNMDEDCDNTLTEDVEEEIQDGDEIVYNGEHLFVTNSDYMDLGKWLWVTDKEEDRYNKKAAGWSLAKELVDEVIGQPEDLDEDTVKQDGKWVNKGKEGTHGEFATKKEADAQRKAMFAHGSKEELKEDVNMTRKEMIDWIEDNWNSDTESADILYQTLDDLGFHIEDDSDEEEGFYANLTDEDLKRAVDELHKKESLKKIRQTLEGIGTVHDWKGRSYGSEADIFDLRLENGDTFRVQVYKM